MPLSGFFGNPFIFGVMLVASIGFAVYEICTHVAQPQPQAAMVHDKRRKPRSRTSSPPNTFRSDVSKNNSSERGRNTSAPFTSGVNQKETVRKSTSSLSNTDGSSNCTQNNMLVNRRKPNAQGRIADNVSSMDDLCFSCQENNVNTVADPCGHDYLCQKCAPKVFANYKKCKVCRTDMVSFSSK